MLYIVCVLYRLVSVITEACNSQQKHKEQVNLGQVTSHRPSCEGTVGQLSYFKSRLLCHRKQVGCAGSEACNGSATMASATARQPAKTASKAASGGTGGAAGGAPAMPLASPLVGGLNKKKKPFLGMSAPLGYVPGLGRGWETNTCM